MLPVMNKLAVLAFSLGLFAVGCSDEGEDDGPLGGAGQGGGGGDAPTLPELQPGWNEFSPPGTICSRGTPYSFWVRPGTTNKVIIDFIGGGACWNELTCGFAGTIFEEDVESVRAAVTANMPSGFYDHDNPDNPLADYYHVIVPYCTGDIHWGDSVTTYGQGTASEVTITHKGAVNARAVLSWVYENFSAPEKIFVTGCSAGSYGAALWSAHVMDHYPSSKVYQFGDSGAGIITQDFFENSFPSWNAQQAFPAFIPALDPAQNDILTKSLPDLYSGIGNHFPAQRLSQYNTVRDENQFFYFQAMGGGTIDDWSAQMLASIDAIETSTPNFAAYIAPGEQHCILPYDNFYTVTANGTRLVDWLRGYVGDEPLASVACQGAECDGPTP